MVGPSQNYAPEPTPAWPRFSVFCGAVIFQESYQVRILYYGLRVKMIGLAARWSGRPKIARPGMRRVSRTPPDSNAPLNRSSLLLCRGGGRLPGNPTERVVHRRKKLKTGNLFQTENLTQKNPPPTVLPPCPQFVRPSKFFCPTKTDVPSCSVCDFCWSCAQYTNPKTLQKYCSIPCKTRLQMISDPLGIECGSKETQLGIGKKWCVGQE